MNNMSLGHLDGYGVNIMHESCEAVKVAPLVLFYSLIFSLDARINREGNGA